MSECGVHPWGNPHVDPEYLAFFILTGLRNAGWAIVPTKW